jgi:hypothetical protein
MIMHFVYIVICILIGLGILFAILAILISFNNSKQKRIEQNLLEREFIEKYGREPIRMAFDD